MSTIVKADATGAVTLPAELCRAAGVEPGADLWPMSRTAGSSWSRLDRRSGSGSRP